jgi:lactate dehydrogenase-like 2-hydroxyacid dehydrogenase
MEKEKVFVTRRIPETGLELLRKECSVVVWPDALPPSQQALLDNVEGAAAILCLLSDRIDAQVMDAAGAGLKVISNYAVGIDNIDVTEATRRGIPVGNTPGVLTEASADHAFALLMAAARRVAEGDRQVRSDTGHHRLRAHWTVYGAACSRFCDARAVLRPDPPA